MSDRMQQLQGCTCLCLQQEASCTKQVGKQHAMLGLSPLCACCCLAPQTPFVFPTGPEDYSMTQQQKVLMSIFESVSLQQCIPCANHKYCLTHDGRRPHSCIRHHRPEGHPVKMIAILVQIPVLHSHYNSFNSLAIHNCPGAHGHFVSENCACAPVKCILNITSPGIL